jgi:hypothetical protein
MCTRPEAIIAAACTIAEPILPDAAEFADEVGRLCLHVRERRDGARIFVGPVEPGADFCTTRNSKTVESLSKTNVFERRGSEGECPLKWSRSCATGSLCLCGNFAVEPYKVTLQREIIWRLL